MEKRLRYVCLSLLNFIVPKFHRKIFFFDRGLISFNEIELLKYAVETGLNLQYKFVLFTNSVPYAKTMFPEYVQITSSKVAGLFHQLTSEYVFVEQNGHSWVCHPGVWQKHIQLWHGTPIKKVGNLNNKKQWYKYDKAYSYVLAPSDYSWKIMKECFGYKDSKKIICPYPRCDAIKKGLSNEQLRAMLGVSSGRIALWLPTFRTAYYENSMTENSFPILDSNNVNVLDEHLRRRNILLVVKIHALQRKYSFFDGDYTNIVFLQNSDLAQNGATLYNLIGESECLISDYSSVIFDYLLQNRPIIFTNNDYSDYKKKRGFITEDIFRSPPGRVVNTIVGLMDAIDEAFTMDSFAKEREILNIKMNQSSSFEFCKEVFRLLGIENG